MQFTAISTLAFVDVSHIPRLTARLVSFVFDSGATIMRVTS